MGVLKTIANAFRTATGGGQFFEAAGQGRRLKSFYAPRQHVNVAMRKAGATLVARARWAYENDGYAGNMVDEWTSAAVGDGIKPRPRFKGKAALKRELVDLFWRWTEEADADGQTDYYGLQEKVARETYLAGECFVRIRPRRPGDMMTVPFQLQVLPTEMLDQTYSDTLPSGNIIRSGIEFNAIGKRVAYHFWTHHPLDERPFGQAGLRERTRVPAENVLHILEGRQAGQIRGVPRIARVLAKLFILEAYDDAELERKRTTALFTGFLIGRGETPLSVNDDDPDEAEEGIGDDAGIAPMQPGAMVDLGDDKDIKFAQPAEVGGSYEPFQYRNLTKIAAGGGVPYAYTTGDTTKGNFSNVRTDIIRFRRRVSQWQNNTLIFQLCRPVWVAFMEFAIMSGKVTIADYADDPTIYWACDHLPPRQEWVDPVKDVDAEIKQIDNLLKSRTQVVAERGYDREDVDREIAEEMAAEKKLGISRVKSAGTPPAPPANDGKDGENNVNGQPDPNDQEESDNAPQD